MAIFYNQATLSYNGNVTSSNIVQGEFREVLSAAKTAVTDDYTANDDVTYVISIVNAGGTDLSDLTVTDDLGAFETEGESFIPLDYVEGSAQLYINGVPGSVTAEVIGGQLVFSGIDIPANGNAIIIYETEVNRFAPLESDGSITNTAVISGTGLPDDITVEETITTEDRADLTISKSVSPQVVIDDNELTYTFVIQNSGSAEATADDEVTVTDTFDPILTGLTVTFNGEEWTEGTDYTYDETTGEFATVPGQITVPAATYTRDQTTGVVVTNPGVSVLTVTGTI